MPETEPHDAVNESRKLYGQHGVAAERLSEAEGILDRAKKQLEDAQEALRPGDSSDATRAAEMEMYRAEGLVRKERERLNTHAELAGMAASDNLDVLIEDAKADMAEQEQAPNSEEPGV